MTTDSNIVRDARAYVRAITDSNQRETDLYLAGADKYGHAVWYSVVRSELELAAIIDILRGASGLSESDVLAELRAVLARFVEDSQ
jgi:hypothetical protein